jgi:threonine/homoserine/homoserine lactone efflux protein
MNQSAALTIVILIAVGIGNIILILAFRAPQSANLEKLSRVMNTLIAFIFSAAAALVVIEILNR